MMPKLNKYLFEEAFRIISANKSKANSLRQSILNAINYDSNFNLKIRQYLGEFEYDLKILYEILNDIKLSFNKNISTLNNSTTVEEVEGEEPSHFSYSNENQNESKILRKNNSSKYFNKFKNKLLLKDLDDNSEKNCYNKKEGKTYSLTINICNDGHFNSNPKNKSKQKINRSNSCKSYLNKYKYRNNKRNNKEKSFKYYFDKEIWDEN